MALRKSIDNTNSSGSQKHQRGYSIRTYIMYLMQHISGACNWAVQQLYKWSNPDMSVELKLHIPEFIQSHL